MQDIYKSWKVKGRKVSKTSSPMIGMVYEGLDKFFGKQVVGVLVAVYEENDDAVLRVRGGVLISVDSTSLRVVTV